MVGKMCAWLAQVHICLDISDSIGIVNIHYQYKKFK